MEWYTQTNNAHGLHRVLSRIFVRCLGRSKVLLAFFLQTMVECLFGVCTPYLLMDSFLIRGPPFLFCDHRIERAKHASHPT